MSALLEVEELEVSFGGRTAAVRGSSFRVEKARPIAWSANPAAASQSPRSLS